MRKGPNWSRRSILSTISGISVAALLGQPREARADQAVKWSTGTDIATIKLPPDATDCHHHIYDGRFPIEPNAKWKPGDALVTDYRLLQKRIGTSRNVVVQPSTYGVDNSLLLSALQEFGASARGVAVANTSVTDAELKRLQDNGVRGLRFNIVTPGATTFGMVEPLAKRVAALGWHLQFHVNANQVAERKELFANLPCPIVFDHMAHLSEPGGLTHPAFAFLVDLMKQKKAWMKLSGAYNDTKIGPPTYADRTVIAQAFVREVPDRLVWGSDWPHPTEKDDHKPNDATLIDLLTLWAPDPATRKAILVDNPAKLYGF